MYNELGTIKDEAGLLAYETKLIDRFGALPKEAKALLNSIRIKWIATQMGIEKIIMKQGKLIGYFVGDQQSEYYNSKQFRRMLQFVQQHGNIFKSQK